MKNTPQKDFFLYEQFSNEELEKIYQDEIESLNIDEFTGSQLAQIAEKHSCNLFEFKDYILTKKKYSLLWHPAGFFIYQRPELKINKLLNAITDYYNTDKSQNVDTLYEIVEHYQNLKTNTRYFSLKSIIEKLNSN